MSKELLNVYFYALYDSVDQQAHSGLIVNTSEDAVREDIERNYVEPRYVKVHLVSELAGIDDGNSFSIIQKGLRCYDCRYGGRVPDFSHSPVVSCRCYADNCIPSVYYSHRCKKWEHAYK